MAADSNIFRLVEIPPILFAASLISAGLASAQSSHWVDGYTTKNGVVVPGHYQTDANPAVKGNSQGAPL